MKRLLCYWAFILLLAAAVGLGLMFAVQTWAQPLAAQFFSSAHLHMRSPVLPDSSVTLLSHCAGLAGAVLVLGEALHPPSTPARRRR
jgi:hypothetical protein